MIILKACLMVWENFNYSSYLRVSFKRISKLAVSLNFLFIGVTLHLGFLHSDKNDNKWYLKTSMQNLKPCTLKKIPLLLKNLNRFISFKFYLTSFSFTWQVFVQSVFSEWNCKYKAECVHHNEQHFKM